MVLLVPNVLLDGRHMRGGNGKGGGSRLPGEISGLQELLFEPFRRLAFQFANQVCDRDCSSEMEQQVNMVGDSADDDRRAIPVSTNSAEIGVHFRSIIRQLQEWTTILG